MPSLSFTNNYTGSSTTADKFLPALHHAISGSAGTLISTCALYPLSLVITRLQAQRQLQREGRASGHRASGSTTTTSPNGQRAAGPAPEPTYASITEAFSQIWSSDGGLKAFYTGLGQDAAKSVLDSFLFFLFYEWFRSARLQASSRRRRGGGGVGEVPGIGMLEELAVGMAAGACSRFFTTPIANVVTRKQTASLVDACGRGEVSVREIVDAIRKDGVSGFWSGYSASLILTLNPSITFFLQEFLKKKTVSSEKWDNPGAAMTFLLAATSKALASAVTYPFQTAKTRLQTGVPVAPESTREADAPKAVDQASEGAEAPKEEAAAEAPKEGEGEAPAEAAPASDDAPVSPKTTEAPPQPVTTRNVAPPERNPGADAKFEAQAMRAVKNFGRQSIFGTVAQIARTEGVGSLYDGLPAELLKGFLSHGTTMLAKGVVHRMLFRLYFIIAGALAEVRARRARAGANMSTMADRAREVMNRSALGPAPPAENSPEQTPKQTPAPTPALSEVSTTTVEETVETIETRALPAPAPAPAPAPTPAPALPSPALPPVPEPAPEPAAAPVTSPPVSFPPLPSIQSPRSPQSLRSRSSSLLQGGAGRPLLPAPSPPSLAPPLLTLPNAPSSSSEAPPPDDSAVARRSSLASSRIPPPPPPQQPRQQLRALRYRLDNEEEWGPNAQKPITATGEMSTGPRRSSTLDDFVVNVVANMIDGTQRGLKNER
ncbi:mitochondrial carrier domain-containing protein [Hypoxylon sp. FL1857]|nr:mitochondrial carrier domain-containing protein [Hypoxylon sp. FL1857]